MAPVAPASGPNLVMVVLDTARADHVRGQPAFSALARAGRSFHRAVAPAPWTLPSHASILSGLRPSEHGITGAAVMGPRGPRSPRSRVEALAHRWLPEVLRRAGYSTFAATANPWVGEAVGLTLGFDEVVETWRDAGLPKLSDPLGQGGGARGGAARYAHAARVYWRRFAARGDGGGRAALAAFRRYLTARRGPFFAFFNVMEPHAPYLPPRPHNPYGAVGRARAMRVLRRWHTDRMIAFSLGIGDADPGDLEVLRTLYSGEVAYSDAWLGRLLDSLDGAGLLGETVVVVTSDHGENLGEHHRLSHIASMHETLLSVPLAVAGPGVPPGEEHAPVSLTALPGMLRALAGGRWEDPAGGPAVAEYESAAFQVSGARRVEDRFGHVPEGSLRLLRTRWTAAYEGRFKLLAGSDGSSALHDLDEDPGEERDVSASHPDVAERLREEVGPWSGEPAEEPGEDVLDAEITAHLEGLGYL